MKKLLFTLITLMLAICLAAPMSALGNPTSWPKEVRFGLMPNEGGGDVIDRFKPLIQHLQTVLGVKVIPVSASDYSGVITGMAHKHIEIAYLGPKSYVEAANIANAQAVVLETVTLGLRGYTGIIIVKNGSPIKNMAQARGHVFAFTEPNSTSGYLVPMVLFSRDLKVDPKRYFKKVVFSGSHDASILGVKNGSIELASTNDLMLNRAIEKGLVSREDFTLIWKGELMPGSPICVRGDLPDSFKAAVAGAMLMFNSNKRGLKKLQIAGYAPACDADYDSIRYLKKLKAQLKKKKK